MHRGSRFVLVMAMAGLSLFRLKAQYVPQFTQFMQTGIVFSPALTGVLPATGFHLGYRKQWAGLPGSPVSVFASGSGRIKREQGSVSLPVRGAASSRFRTEGPVSVSRHFHALGGFLLSDRAGQAYRLAGNLSYAIHLPLPAGLFLSAGAGVSIHQEGIDRSGFNVDAAIDPGVGSGTSSRTGPGFSGGLLVYGRDFFGGYSANRFPGAGLYTISDSHASSEKQIVHHYGFFGANFTLGSDWSLMPSFMIKSARGATPSLDLNFRLRYRDACWFGSAYRSDEALSFFAGAWLTRYISLGYAYDFTLSQLSQTSAGSHEMVMGIRLKDSDPKPSLFW